MKILVVDDIPENRRLIEMHVVALGHTAVGAANGAEAVARFKDEAPDMVLLDVTLPDRDGLEVARELRELSGCRWVPTLFISAHSRHEDILRGLESGGDDYLTKPVDLPLLSAKIRAMQRIADLQREIESANRSLAAHRNQMEMELDLAQSLMAHMVGNQHDVPGIEVWQLPASTFNGDLVVTAQGAGKEIFVLQADSMGHGLPAALPLLSVTQVFRDLTGQGYSTAGLVRAMNRQLQQQIPKGRFVAMTLIRVDIDNSLIEVWNGGCPAALVIDSSGSVIHRFGSRNLPLGILEDGRLDARIEVYHCTGHCRLVVYSDGVTEAVSPEGDAFGEDKLLAAFRGPSSGIGKLKTDLVQHLRAEHGHDDISVLVMNCGTAISAANPKRDKPQCA